MLENVQEKLIESHDLTENIKKHAKPGIRIRILIYLVIALLMVGIVAYDIFMGYVSVIYSSIAICVGLLLGALVSRMHHISWDEDTQKVIARLDEVGIIILVVYIALELNRKMVVEYFIDDGSSLAISFALLAGIMIGRVLGIRRKVKKVLHENLDA